MVQKFIDSGKTNKLLATLIFVVIVLLIFSLLIGLFVKSCSNQLIYLLCLIAEYIKDYQELMVGLIALIGLSVWEHKRQERENKESEASFSLSIDSNATMFVKNISVNQIKITKLECIQHDVWFTQDSGKTDIADNDSINKYDSLQKITQELNLLGENRNEATPFIEFKISSELNKGEQIYIPFKTENQCEKHLTISKNNIYWESNLGKIYKSEVYIIYKAQDNENAQNSLRPEVKKILKTINLGISPGHWITYRINHRAL